MKLRMIEVCLFLFLFGLFFEPGVLGFSQLTPGKKGKEAIRMELVCQSPVSYRMAGRQGSAFAPLYKDYFSPLEEIWVGLNSTKRDLGTGEVRLYVINHNKNKELQDGDRLNDVSGGFEVLTLPVFGPDIFKRVWASPKIREEGYDVVIDFKNSSGQYGTYETGLDIVDTGEKGGFYVPKKWVCLESLSFNHIVNSLGDDALTIRLNSDTAVRVPEWQRGKKAFPVAYVKNSRVTVHPKFISSGDVNQAVFAAHSYAGNLSDLVKAYTNFYPTNGEVPGNSIIPLPHRKSNSGLLLQVRQSTPDRIQSFVQQWDWYLKGVEYPYDKEIYIGTTMNRIYIILAVPQYPWTLAGDTVPWSDLLDVCCRVAKDESKPGNAAGKITQALYGTVGAKYETTGSYSKGEGIYSDFKLEMFFNKIQYFGASPGFGAGGSVGGVNCYDMGKALVTFGNILGCNLTLRYLKTPIDLNCIKPVGLDWDCNMKFENHAFASIGDNIFDASLKGDAWGNPGAAPHRAAWMIDIPWCSYKEMVVKKGKEQSSYPQAALFNIYNKTKQ